eukprot:5955116-Alexandrium_andersonii.AAC.1
MHDSSLEARLTALHAFFSGPDGRGMVAWPRQASNGAVAGASESLFWGAYTQAVGEWPQQAGSRSVSFSGQDKHAL